MPRVTEIFQHVILDMCAIRSSALCQIMNQSQKQNKYKRVSLQTYDITKF